MIDITHKSSTKRIATAGAVLRVSKQSTIDAIVQKTVKKGDVFEMAKTAGLFAVKKTAEMIPDCHPMPVEYTAVVYDIQGLDILIELTVGTVYKTGVEVEAMHGVSVVALTMYDMLKPIDKGIEILNIKLLNKRGGKSDYADDFTQTIHGAVVVCSDSVSAGKKEDKAGKAVAKKLETHGVKVTAYQVIPDEVQAIQTLVKDLCAAKNHVVIITGGTGLSKKDVSPEALKPLLDREIPGVMEAARSYGQARTPYAMLSRGIAGMIGNTLVLALPGSTKGAEESMDALFPAILHLFSILNGGGHSGKKH